MRRHRHHARRGAALAAVLAILLLAAGFAALLLSVHTTHVGAAEFGINRVRAEAAAYAGAQLAVWKATQDPNLQAALATVVKAADTSFAASALVRTDGDIGGAAFHTDLWPGASAARVLATGSCGGVSVTRWAQFPLSLISVMIDYSSGFVNDGKLQFNGGAGLSGTRLQLTSNGGNQFRSTFYNQKLDITGFTTRFTFQFTSATADGFTFCIQNQALNVTNGGTGGGSGLGYQGITPSVAVKFDIYSVDGVAAEVNSTGLYLNGARPTSGFTATPFDFRGGHIFAADITYAGAQLTLKITDTNTGSASTWNYAVDIPQTVGANTAWVGFTAATGGSTATQEVLTWRFQN